VRGEAAAVELAVRRFPVRTTGTQTARKTAALRSNLFPRNYKRDSSTSRPDRKS